MKDQAAKLRQMMGDMPAVVAHEMQPHGAARVIAVTSGKGGVGKTTIAVNIALVLAETSRALLVDGDLGLANIDVMLGIDSGRHMGHLLLPSCSCADVAADGPNGLKVISGGSGLRELAEAGEEERSALIQKLSAYFRGFDYVVVDTSPGIGAGVLDFLHVADEILLVSTSEPTSVRDAYAAAKTIARNMPNASVMPVFTTSNQRQARQALEALNQVTRRFIGSGFDNSHLIEADPMVSRAITERSPLVRSYPRSPAAICLRKLANHILADRKKSANVLAMA